MYTYVLRILKEQREEVKRRVSKGFAEQDIKYTADSFESARPLWRTPLNEVRQVVKDRLCRLTDEDMPDGHSLDDEEHVRLIVNYDSDQIVFEGDVEVPKPEEERRQQGRTRQPF